MALRVILGLFIAGVGFLAGGIYSRMGGVDSDVFDPFLALETQIFDGGGGSRGGGGGGSSRRAGYAYHSNGKLGLRGQAHFRAALVDLVNEVCRQAEENDFGLVADGLTLESWARASGLELEELHGKLREKTRTGSSSSSFRLTSGDRYVMLQLSFAHRQSLGASFSWTLILDSTAGETDLFARYSLVRRAEDLAEGQVELETD